MLATILVFLIIGVFIAISEAALQDAQGIVKTAYPNPVGAPNSEQTTTSAGTGALPFHYVNGSTFTAQVIKSGPGLLYSMSIINGSGASAYVGLFDALSITPGTTVPIKEYLVGAGAELTIPVPGVGWQFNTGIVVFSATAEKGSTGSAANVVIDAGYN